LQFTFLGLTKRPNRTEKAIKEKLIMSFGYLAEKASIEGFFLSIFKAVRNTGKYQQSDMK
jgi:hypothetical protein